MSRDHRPPIRNPFLPSTPEEPEAPTRDGGDAGAPIVISDPDAESAKILQQVADGLSGRTRGLAIRLPRLG